MGTAYTPGLTVDGDATIRKVRRLPLKGEVLVKVGDAVAPADAVARTELPGEVTLVRAADKLGVTPDEFVGLLRKQVGDVVDAGEVLAETPGLFGKFFKSQLTAPCAGTIETVTARTGNLSIRRPPRPVELAAYVRGTVVEVLPAEGAVVEAHGALVQGIFGIGGERSGRLHARRDGAELGEVAGGIVIVPGRATAELYRQAAAAGAVGVVAGSILDGDLRGILGYDIGVAITGEEDVAASLILTEGFGEVDMAERTWRLLSRLDGREASLSGATQIRAGVIRPEIIVPDPAGQPGGQTRGAEAQLLELGTPIRLIREPYFGLLAKVSGLPSEPTTIDTGAQVRVLAARLEDGREVMVPRANVEIVVG